MKRLFLLMIFIGTLFTGCEPMEDIHDEIDAEIANPSIEGATEVRITEDDYLASVEEGGFGLAHSNFSSLEEAKALIPSYLSYHYPVWGKGSLAQVTFDIYNPLSIEDYTVEDEDYGAINLDVNYFTSTSQIEDFLDYQFQNAANGDYVKLTYRTIAEEISYIFDDDDFDLIGDELADEYADAAASAAQYNNFDRREDRDAYWNNDMILDAINVVMIENFDGVTGQTYEVSYDIYDGSAGTESMHVKFDGNNYVPVGGSSYEITNNDYDLIGTELGDEYPGPAGNAAQYNSFDVRSSSGNYWSEDMILEAINVVLNERFPFEDEGAQFDITYDIYNGSVSTVMESVVLADGEYVIDESSSVSTIMETSVFAKANGNWGTPYTLENEDYTAMGQSYPNFDDQDEALYKIAIFLGMEFPYAEEGDLIPVAYDFYSGSTNTRFANFIFESGEFQYVPNVMEETLQFASDGETWVPDNTIVYSLKPSDYALIGEVLAETYPDPAWSVGNYNNFDRRDGNRNYWSKEMLVEAMNVVLNNLQPNAEEGQKYVVSFAIYNGSAGTESLRLIKQGDEWVLNEQ